MEQAGFKRFLGRSGRSQQAADRCIALVEDFRVFLREQRALPDLDRADLSDLDAFVAWLEQRSRRSAKAHLWAIRYYYQYAGLEPIEHHAGQLRELRIRRRPFALRGFLGVNAAHLKSLADLQVVNVEQILTAGATYAGREKLARASGIPISAIEELVKLADLARIPGIKGVRARLYYDAGVDTLDKLASMDPDGLCQLIANQIKSSGSEYAPVLPAEARYSIVKASELPRVVTFE